MPHEIITGDCIEKGQNVKVLPIQMHTELAESRNDVLRALRTIEAVLKKNRRLWRRTKGSSNDNPSWHNINQWTHLDVVKIKLSDIMPSFDHLVASVCGDGQGLLGEPNHE